MVKQRMDLLELLRKRGMDGDVDLLREALRILVDGIMDAEVSAQIGAQHGERSPERVTYRNGYRNRYRNRTWDTRVGTMELHIPKLREGSYFPSLLEPRRRSEKALLAVIQQAYVEGVSTRRVDDLIKALGCDGISSSQVSRICEQLDEVVESFLGRPLDDGPYPYVWLDGLTQKVREGGRIVNVCVVVATGVNAEGQREILGMDVGASEDGAFWLAFLRSLTARGLSGVELVTSDAHQGLKNAIAAVFTGASWQRCRTHFMANLLTRVPKRAQPGVATQDLLAWSAPSTSNCLPPRSTANWTEWWNNSGSCKGRRENVPRGRLDRRVWAVVVQDKCPPKRSAEMSPVYWGIVSDVDAGRVAGDRRIGGVSASMYRLTVSLWRPNSLAILRMDMPWSLAFCTASHLACCRNVDLLGEVVTVMETTSASSMTEP